MLVGVGCYVIASVGYEKDVLFKRIELRLLD
jgi:hypothetical protein